MIKRGYGQCYGTFGEFVQGWVDDHPFLVSFPITLKSKAVFTPNGLKGDIRFPLGKEKVKQAVRSFLQTQQVSVGGHLHIESELAKSKGYASSTADMIASLKAISHALSLPLSPVDLAQMTTAIEPSDGLVESSLLLYNQLNGTIDERFISPYSFVIYGMDTGGKVRTNDCYKQNIFYTPTEKKEMIIFNQLIREGFQNHHVEFIYEATIRSSQLNQRYLPKPAYEEFYKLAKDNHTGVIVAHSGTLLGIILDDSHNRKDAIFHALQRKFGNRIQTFRLPSEYCVKDLAPSPPFYQKKQKDIVEGEKLIYN